MCRCERALAVKALQLSQGKMPAEGGLLLEPDAQHAVPCQHGGMGATSRGTCAAKACIWQPGMQMAAWHVHACVGSMAEDNQAALPGCGACTLHTALAGLETKRRACTRCDRVVYSADKARAAPLLTTMPMSTLSLSSTVASSTRFMNWSNPRRVPVTCLFALSRTTHRQRGG